MSKEKILYLIFDSRYTTDEDRSICLSTAETLKEAKKDQKDFPGSVIAPHIVRGKMLEPTGEIIYGS